MKKFKMVYENGFETVEAKDIFEAAKWAAKMNKVFFKTPIAIEEVGVEYKGPKAK